MINKIIILKGIVPQMGREPLINFEFLVGNGYRNVPYDFYPSHSEVGYCDICEGEISDGYNNIIEQLRRQNLLPDDFEKLCCFCYDEKKKLLLW